VSLRRRIIPVLMVGLSLGYMLIAGGCSNHTENEWQRLVCEVAAINDGVPLVSGYWDAGADRRFPSDDDFLPIDHVPVTFHCRPYNSMIVLPDDAPFSYFHITEYDLIWHPFTEGSEPLVDYSLLHATTDVLVPVRDDATVSILIADRSLKEQPFFSDLFYDPATIPFSARCELRFRGHETGSDEVIEVTGSFMVSFVGIVVQGQ
jgi:hypothetical protein